MREELDEVCRDEAVDGWGEKGVENVLLCFEVKGREEEIGFVEVVACEVECLDVEDLVEEREVSDVEWRSELEECVDVEQDEDVDIFFHVEECVDVEQGEEVINVFVVDVLGKGCED